MCLISYKINQISASRTPCVLLMAACFFLLLVSLTSMSMASISNKEPVMSLTPRTIPLGGLALLDVVLPSGTWLQGISFLGREIPFFPREKHKGFEAILGAGLSVTPGRHALIIRWGGPEGLNVSTISVDVKYRKFPEERLVVARKMVEFPPRILKKVREDQHAVQKVCNMVTPHRYWKSSFVWPVNSRILSPFGLRRIFNGQPRSPHSGVDLRAPEGTPVRSANSGRVALVRNCYLSGWTMVVDHGCGLYTLYAHLSEVRIKQGTMVKRGEILGLSGKTGRATGAHLHWGISLLGTRLDPELFMKLLGCKGTP